MWGDRGRRHGGVGRGAWGGGVGRRRRVLSCPDKPLAALLARQLSEAQLVPHGVQAGLVNAEDKVQGAVDNTLLALEQRHYREEHRVELALGRGLLAGVWLRGRGRSRPDKAAPLLIHHTGFCEHEGVFQVRKEGIIQVKSA
jgi:hypothetical protein